MKLTEEQLERAGRALCRERGVDPDGLVGHGPPPTAQGLVHAVLLQSPAWRLAAREIEGFLALARAIDEGLRDGNTPVEQGANDHEDERDSAGAPDQDAV